MHTTHPTFNGWTEYEEMKGLSWRSRDAFPGLYIDSSGGIVTVPVGEGQSTTSPSRSNPILLTTYNSVHSITRGLPDTWMHPPDAICFNMRGFARNMTVLAHAENPANGRFEPQLWVVDYGNGRVFTTLLGDIHPNTPNDDVIRSVGFQATFVRGVEWAATGGVTYPVPDNFPTADAVSLNDNLPDL
jgi:hypothetical protein